MDHLLIETWVAFVLYGAATLTNFVRGWRGRTRKYHFFATSGVALYITIIYGTALIGAADLRDIGPDYLRLGSILLAGSLVANAVAYWRSSGENL